MRLRLLRSVNAIRIVLLVENNNQKGLNTIDILDSKHWSINSKTGGFYYTTFQWFSPRSTMPTSP